jgi:hypothetical protein
LLTFDEMKKIILLLILIGVAFVCKSDSVNQSRVVPLTSTTNSNPNQAANGAVPLSPKKGMGIITSFEFILSMSVLIFGLIIVIIEAILIKTAQISPENVVKFILITLILTATLFLITAGYDNNQIAPATGLLGTIAGYLLGKNNSKNKTEATK